MGKKKLKTQESLNKNQNISIDSNVIIKHMRGTRSTKTYTLHNEVTKRLLEGILYAISRRTLVASIDEYIPQYLSLGNGTIVGSSVFGVTGLDSELAMERVPVSVLGTVDSDDAQHIVTIRFTATVPYQAIQDASFKEIALFGTEKPGQSMLARIELTNSDKLELGESLYVEWTFGVKDSKTAITE